jgi:hypothetical protein
VIPHAGQNSFEACWHWYFMVLVVESCDRPRPVKSSGCCSLLQRFLAFVVKDDVTVLLGPVAHELTQCTVRAVLDE